MTPAVPDPTVEALSEAERAILREALSPMGAATYRRVPAAVERILAARAAAPDALRVRVEALADEWERLSRMDAFSSMSRFHWGERARDLRALLEDGA